VYHELPIDAVVPESAYGVRTLVIRLAELGHQSLAWVDGHYEASFLDERRDGFVQGCLRKGLELDKQRFFGPEIYEDRRIRVPYKLLQAVHEGTTAMVCANDSIALQESANLNRLIAAEKTAVEEKYETEKPELGDLLGEFRRVLADTSRPDWERNASRLKGEIEQRLKPLDYHQDETPYSGLYREMVEARRRQEKDSGPSAPTSGKPVALAATPASGTPEVSDSIQDYKGKVGNFDATFHLIIQSSGKVSGTYTLSAGKVHLLRLEGKNTPGELALDEFTGSEHTARVKLTLKKAANEIRWEGTMFNDPPDNRVLPVFFSRPR